MTQTIAHPRLASTSTGAAVRVTLALVVALLLVAAFATGRATAPEQVTRTVVSATPADDGGPATPYDCPPSRPPIC